MCAGANADSLFFAPNGNMRDLFVFVQKIDDLKQVDIWNTRLIPASFRPARICRAASGLAIANLQLRLSNRSSVEIESCKKSPQTVVSAKAY